MKSFAALPAAFLAHSALAMVTPPTNGYVLACHGQGCSNCPVAADSVAGYPDCRVYNSADTLGQNYASSSGNGYDVWWDSGKPNPSCKIVVRTPASQDISNCGYYLDSWSDAGCYYTAIQQSFMLQYCCGSGDCEAASPAASIADAHEQAAAGNTTVVSLAVNNLSGAGKRTVEGLGEVTWTPRGRDQTTATSPKKEMDLDSLVARDSCTFHPTSGKTTQAGTQVKASDTQVCNTQGGCALMASVTVTEGESINPSLTANLFSVISAAVGVTFTKMTAYAVSTTYNQKQGTTGYMSYIPTLDCWDGTFSDCAEKKGDNIVKIDPKQSFHACTPALRAGGQIDGTFSFVYSQ